MPIKTFIERSISVLDYSIDWSDWLAVSGDSIATSVWSITPSGLTVLSTSTAGGAAIIWLSGGKPGDTYRVENKITTVGGRQDARTFNITIERSF